MHSFVLSIFFGNKTPKRFLKFRINRNILVWRPNRNEFQNKILKYAR